MPRDLQTGDGLAQNLTENQAIERLRQMLAASPIPADQTLLNLPLFLHRRTLSRLLFMTELYRQIINVHGVVMEFGVRWGRNLALFEALRGVYEPYNHTRRIVGFDTFEGFPSVHEKDGPSALAAVGSYAVTERYEDYLDEILTCQERINPLPDIRKHELVKGDAIVESKRYFEQYPETIVALAYFDLDIYEPTRACLEAIRPHVTKGTVLAFDELVAREFPGETLALKEVFGTDAFEIRRLPFGGAASYAVIR